MSLSSFSSIQFKNDDFPLLSETIFNQQNIEKDGNQISISNLVLLPQVLASLDLPPSANVLKVIDTISLVNLSSSITNTINNSSLIINDVASGIVNTLNYFSVYINDTINGYSNDIGNSYISMLDTNGGNPLTINLSTDHTLDPSPKISLQNSSGLTTMKSDNLTIDAFTISGPKNTLTAGDISIQDYTATMSSLLSADVLTLTNSSASQINLVSGENRLLFIDNTSGANFSLGTDLLSGTHMSNIISNSSDIFVNSNTKQFFKFNNAGYSYKPLLVSQDQTIQRYMNYIVIDDGVTNVNLDTYTNLLDSDTTLPDIDRVGWSCKFVNLNNVDVSITDTNGFNFFSHYGGLTTSPYTLKKWSVVELTLIWSNNLSQYLFAVSQY